MAATVVKSLMRSAMALVQLKVSAVSMTSQGDLQI
jgi:hypothetical protein